MRRSNNKIKRLYGDRLAICRELNKVVKERDLVKKQLEVSIEKLHSDEICNNKISQSDKKSRKEDADKKFVQKLLQIRRIKYFFHFNIARCA